MFGSKSSLLRRILWQSRRCWPHLFLIFVLSVLAMVLTLIVPLPLKIAVDSIAGASSLPKFLQPLFPNLTQGEGLLLAVGLMLATALLINLQGLCSGWLQTYTGEKLVWDFRAQLLDHVQRLPMSFHDRNGTLDSAYRIQHDAPAIQYVVIQGLVPMCTAMAALGIMLYVCMRLDLQISLIALSIAFPLFFLTRACSRQVRNRSNVVKELDSSALNVVQEVLGSIRVVKAFGQETREYERFVRHSQKRQARQVKLAFTQGLFNVAIGLVIATGSAAALYVGARHVSAGKLTVGDLLILVTYIAQLYEPLRLVSNKITDLHGWAASLDRALLLLDETPEITEVSHPLPLVRARGHFEFRNVSFQYHQGQRGLRNVSFQIPPGARVGIMGSSGAGKTTLINLLMRFYDATEGSVLLDGHDLRQYRIHDLRRQFSVVLQEPVLFATSVAENIAYAKPEASNEEIYAAAQAANSHEFISHLPEGYETGVGERGSRLSGGERQRISLARAFLRNSPVLVLDEPTSSVDLQTEAAIASALQTLMRERTTFIIAHRLETLKSCDLLLVLRDGELAEIRHGAPDEYLSAYVESMARAAAQKPMAAMSASAS